MRVVICIIFSLLITQSLCAFDGKFRHYRVYFGPAVLADIKVSLLAVDGGIQSVDVIVESSGFGAWFSGFKSTLEILRFSDGRKFLNGVSVWDEATSQVEVNWFPGSKAPTVDLYRSKPPEYEMTPVHPKSIEGTVDPFLPVFDIGRSLSGSGTCEGKYRIYDGIRRYNLVITDEGKTELLDDAVEGLVYQCGITVERLGGFSKKRGLFSFDESEISRTLYFGHTGEFWIPVRFEIESPIGKVITRLIKK